MTAKPYRPPAAEVRDVKGTFLQTSDSVWWRDARLALPSTQAQMTGTYLHCLGIHCPRHASRHRDAR